MKTIAEHLEKAGHNLAFLNTIDAANDTCADWAIVVLFYRALHLVSAVIHSEAQDHGTNHKQRWKQVHAVFSPPTAQSYLRLYSRSRELRYDEVASTASEFHRLLNSDFEPLLRDVRSHLPNAA